MKPELLTYILQRIMAEGIPDSWKKSKLIPILKNKGDILECNNDRGIKLMSHFMKLWKRIIEARLREIINIRENQFGFRPGMSTTEPVFALRQLQEKCREKNKDLHMVFVDLEKALVRIPRDLIWWCLRMKVEEDLETWRVVFERHGLKISRTKTEYLPSPTNAKLPTVTSFK